MAKSIKTRKRIAIIGASYLQLPLILKAKDMGYETHVFAWKANDVGETAADFFYPISIVEKEEILRVCRELQVDGICSIASDLAMIAVNYVANDLGLQGNSIEATNRSTNKHEMRLAFEQGGDPSLNSMIVDEKTDLIDLPIKYPVVVKPTDRSGSRGIRKLEDARGLEEAIQKALEESFEKKALIEEYAEGEEYSVEGLSYRGEHHILAITQKHTTGGPNYIETGHVQPAEIGEGLKDKIEKTVIHALGSLGIENGASHSEIKIDSRETIRIIEIGGRMGGDCIGSDLVRLTTGVDYVKAVIQVACGEEPDLTSHHKGIKAEVRYIFNREDIEELDRIKKNDPEQLIKIVDYHPERIGHITDSSNRAGCYIIRKR